MTIFQLLRLYLTLGVDTPDPEPETAPEPDLSQADEPELPDLGTEEPEAEAALEEDTAAQIAAAKREAEEARREASEARARAESIERQRPASPPQPSRDQLLFQQEEERLRAADISAQERWQIESNRVLRENQRLAANAAWQAKEMQDKMDFGNLQTANPLVKKYASRVEAKLNEMRAQGFNLERKLVLKMLIGDDIVEGKVKTGTKKTAEASPAVKVNRGLPATQRGDVRGRGAANSESAKRRARLEGQII